VQYAARKLIDSMHMAQTVNTRDLILWISSICITLLPRSSVSDAESRLRPAWASAVSEFREFEEYFACDFVSESGDETAVKLSNVPSTDCKRRRHKQSRAPYRKAIDMRATVSMYK
jgi:hypothetical protein